MADGCQAAAGYETDVAAANDGDLQNYTPLMLTASSPE
jgi:hypothetical protein